MPIGPLLTWKRADFGSYETHLGAAGACGGWQLWLFLLPPNVGHGWHLSLLALALGQCFGSFKDIVQRINFGKVPFATAWARYKGLPLSAHGAAIWPMRAWELL